MANLNLRHALKLAHDAGCSIRNRKGTGETVISHPAGGRVTVNHRRKDTPRAFVTFLRRLGAP